MVDTDDLTQKSAWFAQSEIQTHSSTTQFYWC